MKITKINNTDLFVKCLSGAQTIPEGMVAPTVMDAVNMFGELNMTIEAELEPLELLYLIESDHELWAIRDEQKNPTDTWRFKLNSMDIVYNFPSLGLDYLYDGKHTIQEILDDEAIRMQLANGLTNTARQRFATNGFINNYIIDGPAAFNGWNMDLIGIGKTTIPPKSPQTDIMRSLHQQFEQEVQDEVGHCLDSETDHAWSTVYVTYSKCIGYQELIEILSCAGLVKITNVSYGIQQLIHDGVLSENMYSVTQQMNVVGQPYKAYEFDPDAVNEVLRTKAKLPIVIQVPYVIEFDLLREGDDRIFHEEDSQFDRYAGAIMLPNYRAALHEIESSEDYQPVDRHGPTVMEPTVHTNAIEDPLWKKRWDELADAMHETIDIMSNDQWEQYRDRISQYMEELTNPDHEGESDSQMEDDEPTPEPVTKKKKVRVTPVKFFVQDGNFDSLRMVEQNPEYQEEDVVGIVSMLPDNPGGSKTYYVGHPVHSDVDTTVRYRWSRKTLDEIFDKVDRVNVEHWLRADGTIDPDKKHWTRKFEEQQDGEI